jgi:hypothetical protein
MPEAIIVPVIFLSIVAIVRISLRHREKMATMSQPPDARAIAERLMRMEQSIEAMAIEMERVGEGQRFVTKLLADRDQALPAASSSPERINAAN